MSEGLVLKGEELSLDHVVAWAKDDDATFYGDGVDDDLALWDRNWISPLIRIAEDAADSKRTVILNSLETHLYRIFIDDGAPVDIDIREAVSKATVSRNPDLREWAREQMSRISDVEDGLVLPADFKGLGE